MGLWRIKEEIRISQLIRLCIENQMNWYKKAQVYGEWWITDTGDVLYADGDVGDYNHEMYVIEQIVNEYFDTDLMNFDFASTSEEEMAKASVPQDAINVLRGRMDAREYGMKNLGWVRVSDKYIQSWYLTGTILKNIANGLYETYGTDAFRNKYVVESLSNGKNYSPVPYEAIDSGNPKNLLPYREWDPMNLKSSSLNWFKRSQVENYKYYEDIGHDVEDKMNILWISDLSGNNFHTVDAQHYNEEYDQDYNYDHVGFAYDVGLNIQTGTIQGRFDPNKNIVSLHLDPRIASMRELPNRLLNNLYRAFGDNITILDYSHGSPKVVV